MLQPPEVVTVLVYTLIYIYFAIKSQWTLSEHSEPALIHKHSNEENPADNQLVMCQ